MAKATQYPLLGKFDEDPGRWRPYKYETTIEVPVEIDGSGEGTIQILNQPFIMTRITHQIIGNTEDGQATGLYQDGQYYIDWKDELSQYQNDPILAEAGYGSSRFQSIPLDCPIPFAGNKTLTFRVINAYTRVLSPESDIFYVQIVVHGIADWGSDRRVG